MRQGLKHAAAVDLPVEGEGWRATAVATPARRRAVRPASNTRKAQRVAAEVGVSLPLVYEAMRADGGRVARETRERILKAAESIGYQPSWGARVTARRRTDHIGIINATHYTLFTAGIYPLIFNDLTRLLGSHGLSTQLVFDQVGDPRAIEPLRDHRFDGALVLHELSAEARASATRARLPLVLINAVDPLGQFHQVVPDDAAGAMAATEHLLSMGHRRIVLVSAQDVPAPHFSVPRREAGYRRAMTGAGLNPQVIAIRFDGHEHAGEAVLACDPRPTAIIVTDDRVAFLMLQDLWRRRVRVPEDLSVIAFNDTLLGQGSVPDMTVMAVPTRQMSELAVRLLLPQMRGRGEAPATEGPSAPGGLEHLIREELIVRGSSGPLRV